MCVSVCVCWGGGVRSTKSCEDVVVSRAQSKSIPKLAGPEKFVIIIVPGFISVWRSSSSFEDGKKEEKVAVEKGWKNCWDCTAWAWTARTLLRVPRNIRRNSPVECNSRATSFIAVIIVTFVDLSFSYIYTHAPTHA